ncbi:MAG: DUF4412 domain-containing protein [Bacteroidetes bacterium]|jgi:hypothetical protein|nr:DUF4412 domain-containing protein [Bacteroidota bacterium]
MVPFRLSTVLGFALAFLFLLPQSEAQILNRLKRKAERAAEKRVEEEFDKALAEKVDEEFEKDSTRRDGGDFGGYDRTESALADAIAGEYMDKFDMSDVELPETYTFDLKIEYEIKSEGEDPIYMAFIIPPDNEKYMGFTGASDQEDFQYMIWDLERNVFVMYQENEGEKSLMKLPNFASIAEADQEKQLEASEMEIRKTGETKTILGYTCEKYIIEDDKNYGEAWIADDFPYSYERFSALVSTQMKTPGYSELSEEKGYALEMLTREKKKNAKTTVMKVVNVDETGLTITNSEYASAR